MKRRAHRVSEQGTGEKDNDVATEDHRTCEGESVFEERAEQYDGIETQVEARGEETQEFRLQRALVQQHPEVAAQY